MDINSMKEHRYLFHEGTDHRAYEYFGSHVNEHGDGYVFRVWAPDAVSISVVGDFNGWDRDACVMTRLPDDDSIWEGYSEYAHAGDLYKYLIFTDDGRCLYKADPYAFESEDPRTETGSQRASRICDPGCGYRWTDAEWIASRDRSNPFKSPVNIYEVHLGSWRQHEDGSLYTYDELADELVDYAYEMGYTHIEIMPIMEHPYNGSWGYQVTGYFSVSARYGSAPGFMNFVNRAHEKGIGVILDWVPAHFPKDEHGLCEFDGHPLYEYSDPFKMEHKGWGTRVFDYGRPEVVSFLMSSAYYFCEMYHVDGLRVDAVSSMIYLNYDRTEGEWAPNEDGGIDNREAVKFLQELNRSLMTDFPGLLMIAEESTAWEGVTLPPAKGGLGFRFKWNMGWMNDVLGYFQTDTLFRGDHQGELTFSMHYAYDENFILPLSHDEVVHGKHSLIEKMPGEYDEKFAGLRTLFGYMFTHPGKKLSFMGNEFAQFIEWNENQALDWMLLEYPRHSQMREYIRAINTYYRITPALWKNDDEGTGFRWIDAGNTDDCIITYARLADDNTVIVILNLSGKDMAKYDVGVPMPGTYVVAIDSDWTEFGGAGSRLDADYDHSETIGYRSVPGDWNGMSQHITLSIPKLSALILEHIE